MVNWLRSLFKKALNARKRVRYIDTLLRRYKFAESDVETALLLYDHMKVIFTNDATGSLYLGKKHSDGSYFGQCIGYCGRFGVILYSKDSFNGPYSRKLVPFTVSELFKERPELFVKLNIPRFKSTAELKMKLELSGKV